MAAAVALMLSGCTSYEIDMPENPVAPVVGNEVTTNVIYEANPRFFGSVDCLRNLTAQLDRISDMGCDILWVMPIYEQGELNSIGSPYCISNFKGVNVKYGTLEDARTLVNSAHAKGMKVIFDWVANHTSWDHPWIEDNPNFYKHDEDGNIVSPSKDWKDVAQLDFNNPATCDAMKDAMLYWVKELNIDGYRCDYAEGVPGDFWSDVITDLEKINKDIIMLAETSNATFYEYGFDMIYDWNSGPTISSAFHGGDPSGVVKEAADALQNVPDGKSILRYAFNHDVAAENDFDTYFGSADGIPAAYVCASMLNGTPMIYSGMDATGITGKLSFFNYSSLDFSNDLSHKYKVINDVFRQTADVRRGQLGDYYSGNSVVCFTRRIPGKTMVVAVNVSDASKEVKVPISLVNTTMSDLITGKTVNLSYTMEIEAYGYAVLVN